MSNENKFTEEEKDFVIQKMNTLIRYLQKGYIMKQDVTNALYIDSEMMKIGQELKQLKDEKDVSILKNFINEQR